MRSSMAALFCSILRPWITHQTILFSWCRLSLLVWQSFVSLSPPEGIVSVSDQRTWSLYSQSMHAARQLWRWPSQTLQVKPMFPMLKVHVLKNEIIQEIENKIQHTKKLHRHLGWKGLLIIRGSHIFIFMYSLTAAGKGRDVSLFGLRCLNAVQRRSATA